MGGEPSIQIGMAAISISQSQEPSTQPRPPLLGEPTVKLRVALGSEPAIDYVLSFPEAQQHLMQVTAVGALGTGTAAPCRFPPVPARRAAAPELPVPAPASISAIGPGCPRHSRSSTRALRQQISSGACREDRRRARIDVSGGADGEKTDE
jgi:hypothetical protein